MREWGWMYNYIYIYVCVYVCMWMEGMRVRDKIKIGGNAAPRVMFGKEEELWGGIHTDTRRQWERERERESDQPTNRDGKEIVS